MLFKRDHNNRHGAVRQNSNSRSRGVPSILSDGFKSEGDIISDGEVHILGAHSGNLVAHKLTLGEGGSITGTVEAETDDGWMRFENLEHLEEYLDAMSPGQN